MLRYSIIYKLYIKVEVLKNERFDVFRSMSKKSDFIKNWSIRLSIGNRKLQLFITNLAYRLVTI